MEDDGVSAGAAADAELIQSIAGCIAEGIVSKMDLVAAAIDRSDASKRALLAVLERYTGTDPSVHRWNFSVHARGEKRYALLRDLSAQRLITAVAQLQIIGPRIVGHPSRISRASIYASTTTAATVARGAGQLRLRFSKRIYK